MTQQEFYDLALKITGNAHAAYILTGIAGAESSYNPTARNQNTDSNRTIDRGILQINNYWWPGVTDAQADDPSQAIKIAYNEISKHGTDFTPWSTYNSGAYKSFLPGSDSGGGNISTPSGQTLGFNPFAPGDILGSVKTFIDAGAYRVGIFFLAGVIMLLGVGLLLYDPAKVGVKEAFKGAMLAE